jgi:hypothetical protein
MNTVEVTHYRCPLDGTTKLVSVPLTNVDKSAVLFETDFDMLMSLGLDPRWRLSQGMILEKGRARRSISRLVANAGPGNKILFLDRDVCNMRRDNLIIANGTAKYQTRDKLTGKRNFLRERVQIKHTYTKAPWENAA